MERQREIMLVLTLIAFALFMFAFQSSTEVKTFLVFAFYVAISLIYSIDSRYPVILGIVFLIASALLLQRDEALSDRLAIYAYYSLVAGVVLSIAEYLREREEEKPCTIRNLCLVIASGKGGVGKTTLASNLAVTFAKLGRRVLLVDLDLSMPNVDVVLGVKVDAGLKECLLGEEPEKCIHSAHGVDILAASPLLELSSEQEERLRRIIEELTGRYDVVILDLPPGKENLELVPESAYAIIVAMPEKTSLVNAVAAAALLQERCTLLGFVLNMEKEPVDLESIEEGMGASVIGVLQYDEMNRESVNSGVPLAVLDENREFSRGVADIARFLCRVLGEEEK